MLHTLTGNLLVEWTAVYARDVHWGRTHRAKAVSFQVGGKGINVAKMAHRLGIETVAIGFAGGHLASAAADWLATQPWTTRLFPLEGETRGGWVVRTAEQAETTFLGVDAPLPLARWKEALTWLLTQPVGWVAICGSFPGWSSAHRAAWQAFVAPWQSRGGQIAVDSYGPPFADLCRPGVDLLKVNRDEWHTAQATTVAPAAITIISDGPRAVTWQTRDGATGILTPPVVAETSATGSGDVLLACLLAARMNGLDWPEALARALPYASANAADPGVATFALEGLPELG